MCKGSASLRKRKRQKRFACGKRVVNMGIVNRILLFILAVAAILLSALSIGAFFQFPAESVWLNEIHFALGCPETLIVAFVFLVVSVRMLFVAFSRSSDDAKAQVELALERTENGDVHVSIEAIRSFLESTAREVREVVDAKARIVVNESDSSLGGVSLRLIVSTRAGINELSAQLRNRVQERLEQSIGVKDVRVDVSVVGITNEMPQRKQRVV